MNNNSNNKQSKELNERDMHILIYDKQYKQKVGLAYAFMSTSTLYILMFMSFLYINNLDFLFVFNIDVPTDVMLWTFILTILFYRKFLDIRKDKYQTLPIMQKLIELKKRSNRNV